MTERLVFGKIKTPLPTFPVLQRSGVMDYFSKMIIFVSGFLAITSCFFSINRTSFGESKMFDDCDIVFDDKFIRDNLSFLLDDEFSGITKFQLSRENEISIKDVVSKLECSMNMSWSSSSSGSICSIKEESTKYVNVCLCPKQKPSLSLETRFCFDFEDASSLQCDESFIKDFPTVSTSTPIKKYNQAALPEMKSSSEIWSDTSSILDEAMKNSSYTLEAENICNFCRKNGEPEHVYSSHLTKMTDGTVICPILKKHACELCGATGQKAHTRRYCPLYKRKFQPPTSTRRLSNGVVVSRLNHK